MIWATGSRSRGFTLIELIVVLAILVGLTVAFPMAMERLQPERQLHVQAERLAADLRQLRTEAMTQNRIARMDMTPQAHAYRLEPDATSRTLPDAVTVTLYSTGTVATPAAATSTIRFFPDGSASGGIVQLSRGDLRTRVSVGALTGQVHVE